VPGREGRTALKFNFQQSELPKAVACTLKTIVKVAVIDLLELDTVEERTTRTRVVSTRRAFAEDK